MWFFNNSRNLSKLEEKVAQLEDKLNQRYEEYDSMHESLNVLCKELRDFLTEEENTVTIHDIQQEEDNLKAIRQNRETGTQDR
jgi:chromosome segregation ATPase